MKFCYVPDHTSCANYVSDIQTGFRLMSASRGEFVEDRSIQYNTIVFILSGTVEVSCDEILNRVFVEGEILFFAQASTVTGSTLTDVEFLVFTFISPTITLCEKYTLHAYVSGHPKIQYSFRSLACRGLLKGFLELMKSYLGAGVSCGHLHELKQRELFILLRATYTKRELAEFFYPIIGADFNFKAAIFEKYKLGYTIAEFARELALSSGQFVRKFNREFGMSYYQWVLKQKANHIKHRLALDTTTISDVINEFNFSSPSHFTQFCKVQFGCTPLELIKKLRSAK